MIRPAAAVLAVVSLPVFAPAQEPATHTVVRGNTLWGIAAMYYGDPYRWPRIFDANRDRIENPHRIAPGLVVRIPAAEAPGAPLAIRVEPGPSGQAPAPAGPRVESAQERPPRTVFYRERQAAVTGVGTSRGLWDVPPEQFYSAPWLIPPGTTPQRSGAVLGFSGAGQGRAGTRSAHPFDRLEVGLEGQAPAPGSRLQAFRVEREIENVGHVVVPTGVLLVEAAGPEGVVAVVESQFDRILMGDLVRPLPPYTPLSADALATVRDGPEAVVLGYAVDHAIQVPGGYAFLDRGAEDGVSIGDEYVLVWSGVPVGAGEVEGRVKVQAVLPNVSTARIVHLENPVFVPGVRLRPDRVAR